MKVYFQPVIAIFMLFTASLAHAEIKLEGKAASAWRTYDRQEANKAFAINGLGAYGYSYKAVSPKVALELAISACERHRSSLRKKEQKAAECEVINSLAR